MKTLFAVLSATLLSLVLVSGCHAGQQSTTPPVLTCPPATFPGTNYTELNPPASNFVAASITGTTFKFSPPSIGSWCAVIQAWALPGGAPSGSAYQVSVPSNISGPLTTTSALPNITYTWTLAPTATYPTYTYILSYVPAIQSPVPLAPNLAAPVNSADLLKPVLPSDPALPQLALVSPIKLVGHATR